MSTKSKFTIIMVLTSLFGAIVFGLLSFLEGRSSLREAAFDELTAIRTARIAQIETYFESVFDEVNVITENPLVSESIQRLTTAFHNIENDPVIAKGDYEAQLRAFYVNDILPEITSYLTEGSATYGGYGPKTQSGTYLQYKFLAENKNTWRKRDGLSDTNGPTAYEKLHAEYHNELKFIVDEFGYYDMFLIDHKTGDIIYGVRKEPDFATNIYEGPYRGSLLGNVVDKVKADPSQGAVYMSDVEFYVPSKNLPAFFVASGVYEDDDLKGILAIQLTLNDIDNIMTSNRQWSEVGLKESGETYIVGDDYYMRNVSRFVVEDFDTYLEQLRSQNVPERTIQQLTEYKSNVLIQKVKTEGVEKALAGKTDTRVIDDYRGVPVLSAYAPLTIKGMNYAVLAEMDAAEAFKPVRKLMLNTAITTGIVIPFTALIGIWLSSLLMRPSHDMRNTAKLFMEGQEDVRFQDRKNDEWGRLGTTLNGVLDMAKSRLGEAETSRKEIIDMTKQIMPGAIGERYSQGENRIISHEDNASAMVLLLSYCRKLNNKEEVERSRNLYEILDDRLDELAAREGVDMQNQAGMHYVAFCGLTAPMKNHAERLFRYGLHVRRLLNEFNAEYGTDINMQMGFDSGALFGALIGNYSMAYEIWGEAIHKGFDMAYNSSPGTMTISSNALKQIGIKIKSKPVKVKTLSGTIIDAKIVTDFPEPNPA